MGNLEADLAAIEIRLESNDFIQVLNMLDKLKSEYKSYKHENSGYLVDFYLGEAIFRKEMQKNKNPKEIIKAKQYLKDSLELNPNFADSYILAGYASMVLANHPQHNDRTYNQLDARYHLKKSIELNPALSKELNSKVQSLEQSLSHIPKVVLCSIHEEMVLEWMIEFEKFPWVKIVHEDILKQNADAIVSPANSFGFMDGGLDYTLSEYFGWDLQETLQQKIRQKHNGELLIGTAEVLETKISRIPYLISAPTMRVPMQINDTINPYLATKAVFNTINEFNSDNKKITSVIIPSMGTGVGNVSFSVAARQMRAGYEDIVLNRNKFPKDFAEAQRKHRGLSMDYYHQLYKGEY